MVKVVYPLLRISFHINMTIISTKRGNFTITSEKNSGNQGKKLKRFISLNPQTNGQEKLLNRTVMHILKIYSYENSLYNMIKIMLV
jgi:hypothetical protein